MINILKGKRIMKGYKVINDSVHGHMEFHPLCIKVIDTLEFQRLRNIRQLGLTHLVYPSAAHSRFEHSLGVCHLAGLMIEELKKNNPSIIVTEEERLCVLIAGLCHDLGHGPFSHLWEDFLRRRGKEWKHEDQSIKMFEHLLEKNELKKDFADFNLKEKEIGFIKALILGEGEPLDQKKQFLFQVVNNKINDIDVNKWDQYLRDGLHLNLKFSFDYTRMMKFIKIMSIPDEGSKEVLVFKDKEAYSIYEMLNVRAKILFAAAQHRVVLALDRMVLDALCAADNNFLHCRSKLSEAHETLDAWTKLTDNILFSILYHGLIENGISNPGVKENDVSEGNDIMNHDKKENAESNSNLLLQSQNILNDLLKRHLYKFITSEEVSIVPVNGLQHLTNDLEKELGDQFPRYELVVSNCCFHLSSIGKDPFERVYFYNKRNPNQLVKKKWNDIELFRSAEDRDPKPHCKFYIFSKNWKLGDKEAKEVRSRFPKILQTKLEFTENIFDSNSSVNEKH